MDEITLMLIKPDGVERNLTPRIIGMLASYPNLRIIGIKPTAKVSQEIAKIHYFEHRGKDYFTWLIEQITSGPIFALAICGPDAITNIRKLAGSTDPAKAAPESIRGEFGNDDLGTSRKERRAVRNLVHTADGSLSAKRELEIWFSPDELLPY